MPEFTSFVNSATAGNNLVNKEITSGNETYYTINFIDNPFNPTDDFNLPTPAFGATVNDANLTTYVDEEALVVVDGQTYAYYVEGFGSWPIINSSDPLLDGDQNNDGDRDDPGDTTPLTGVKIVLIEYDEATGTLGSLDSPGAIDSNDTLAGTKLVFTLEENQYDDTMTPADWIALYDGLTNGNITLEAPEPGDPPPPPLCFGAGTKILTSTGEQKVEDLEVGDLVMTRDAGLLPIRWIGSSIAVADEKFAPIVFAAGAINNREELTLSPQHHVLVSDWRATLLVGEDETLVKAKDMVNSDTIYRKTGGTVKYFHILLDGHQLVYANGVLAETMLIGAEAEKALDAESLEEIKALFPEKFEDGVGTDEACIHIASSNEARALLH